MKSKYLMIGAAVCAALFLFSGIMLCRQYADEKLSAEAFEQVAALVETEPAPTDDMPQEAEPLAALTWFFAAVIMVIIATYLLFISKHRLSRNADRGRAEFLSETGL